MYLKMQLLCTWLFSYYYCNNVADTTVFTAVMVSDLAGAHEFVPWDSILIDTASGYNQNRSV